MPLQRHLIGLKREGPKASPAFPHFPTQRNIDMANPKRLSEGYSDGTVLGNSATDLVGFFNKTARVQCTRRVDRRDGHDRDSQGAHQQHPNRAAQSRAGGLIVHVHWISVPTVNRRHATPMLKSSRRSGFLHQGSGRLAIVGGGNSIKEHVDELRSWDGDVWAVNGTINWCMDNGIKAAFYTIDAQPLENWVYPLHRIKRAVLAADCNPDVISKLVALGCGCFAAADPGWRADFSGGGGSAGAPSRLYQPDMVWLRSKFRGYNPRFRVVPRQ
jgi:hypothetical protein